MDALIEDQEFNLKDVMSDAFSVEYHKNALLESAVAEFTCRVH